MKKSRGCEMKGTIIILIVYLGGLWAGAYALKNVYLAGLGMIGLLVGLWHFGGKINE